MKHHEHQLRIAAQLLLDTWDKHGGDPRPWVIRPNIEALRAAMAMESTQGPDHELQPAEPALDFLESHDRRPMSLRDRLLRFATRDPHQPYTGSWD
jgi:hypothetical protein